MTGGFDSGSAEQISLARFDVGKSAFFALITLALAVLPNLPGMESGGLAAFLYTTGTGVAVRWSATMILVVISSALAFGVLRAVLISPTAVWLTDGELRWGWVGTRAIPLSNVRSLNPARNGHAIEIATVSGRKEFISTRGLRSTDAPLPLIRKIKQAMGE